MMMLEFSIFPVGSGESLSGAVAEAVNLVRKSGLRYRLTDMGTIVEGPSGDCLRVIEQCIEALAGKYGRISCTVKIDYRKGGESRLGKKAESVKRKMKKLKE